MTRGGKLQPGRAGREGIEGIFSFRMRRQLGRWADESEGLVRIRSRGHIKRHRSR